MTAARVKVAPGVYRLPSGSYQAQVMIGGIRMSETYPTEKQATAWRSGLAARAEKGDRLARRGAMTFGAFWPEFDLTRRKAGTRKKQYELWRARIESRWSRVAMRSVTGPALDVWAMELERDGLAESTIRTIVYVMSAMYREAKRHRYVESNPVTDMDRRPAMRRSRARILTDAEVETLLDTVGSNFSASPARALEHARMRAMIVLMRETGARLSEAAALTARGVREDRIILSQHIDPTGIVPGLKESDPAVEATMTVEAPYTAYLREHLEPLLVGLAPDDLLFPSRTGRPLNLRVWRNGFDRVVARANLADPQPRPHDLRRTFATVMADANVPLHRIRDALGQRSTRSIEPYLRTTATSLPTELAGVMDARRVNGRRGHLHAVS